MTRESYGPDFYRSIAGWADRSAAEVVPVVLDLLPAVGSVLDVGCGTGSWLAAFARHGVAEVVGLDQQAVPLDQRRVPGSVSMADLRQPFDLGRRFDLVMSTEVAEHLPMSAADGFVDSLSRHGDLVLFSAAVPHQGGHDHVNEQWPSWWAARFAAAGYEAADVLRPRIWTNRAVAPFYRQNLLVFARNDALRAVRAVPPVPLPLDVVHPALWEERLTWTRGLWRSALAATAALIRERVASRSGQSSSTSQLLAGSGSSAA